MDSPKFNREMIQRRRVLTWDHYNEDRYQIAINIFEGDGIQAHPDTRKKLNDAPGPLINNISFSPSCNLKSKSTQIWILDLVNCVWGNILI